MEQGRTNDTVGGGLIRSAGGWEGFNQKREEGRYQRNDQRILGDSDFVSEVLEKSNESLTKRQKLKSKGMDVDKIALHVSRLTGLAVEDVWARLNINRTIFVLRQRRWCETPEAWGIPFCH